MRNSLVSIIIPVFNGSNYLKEAIDSALAQTYPYIEIIVINDGSSDNNLTEKIALSYGEKIKYFCKENGGCASALNYGIKKMKGSYFSWLSHDDKYFPEKISTQLETLNRLNEPNTIIYGGYEVIDQQSKVLHVMDPSSVLTSEQLNISLLPLMRGLIHGCSLLIPKKYFDEIGMFPEQLKSTQDYALWFDFLRVAPIHFEPQILIQSRVHPDQGTHKISGHIQECNELWTGFLNKLTHNEMADMEQTPGRFMSNEAKFLSKTPYTEAEHLAKKMTDDILKTTMISVIIPFHNRVDLVIQSIKSVLLQTHQTFELILIDDGSTDDVSAVMDLINLDPRITYHRKENAGPAAARNLGVKLARGYYIAFLDSDDIFLPRKLESQIKFMEKNACAFSHTSYQQMDMSGKKLQIMPTGGFKGYVFPAIISSCIIAMPTVMVLASVLKKYKFRENIDIGEDVCLWIELAYQYEIAGIDEVLSMVRIGPLTTAYNQTKQMLGLINIISFLISHPQFNVYTNDIKKLITLASVTYDEHLPIKKRGRVVHKKSLRNKYNQLLNSIRVYGFFMTLRKIKYRIMG